jgi:hypothetical protein
MENVTLPSELIAGFKKFKSNFEAANEMYDQLQDHIGKYVAIDDGKILGYADTYEEAVEKYGKIVGIYIDLVSKENIFWIL